jgi:hypothetical protein
MFVQCLEFLNTYRSVIVQMPFDYAQLSVTFDWTRMLTRLLQTQDIQQAFQEILYVFLWIFIHKFSVHIVELFVKRSNHTHTH